MASQTINIESVDITFDKDATAKQYPANRIPCDCPYCRHYYRYIEQNTALAAFLDMFGADPHNAEEVVSWENGSGLHCIGHYDIEGQIERAFSFGKYGVTISFENSSDTAAPSYFWINIECNLPFSVDT